MGVWSCCVKFCHFHGLWCRLLSQHWEELERGVWPAAGTEPSFALMWAVFVQLLVKGLSVNNE